MESLGLDLTLIFAWIGRIDEKPGYRDWLSITFLLVMAALIAPFLVPVDVYKQQAVQQFEARTGRALTLGGPVKFSLLPSIALDAENVAISNPRGLAAKR